MEVRVARSGCQGGRGVYPRLRHLEGMKREEGERERVVMSLLWTAVDRGISPRDATNSVKTFSLSR